MFWIYLSSFQIFLDLPVNVNRCESWENIPLELNWFSINSKQFCVLVWSLNCCEWTFHSLRDWAHAGVVLYELPTASSHCGSTGVLWVLTGTHPCGPGWWRLPERHLFCGVWSWCCCQVVLWSHREVWEYQCISTNSLTWSLHFFLIRFWMNMQLSHTRLSLNRHALDDFIMTQGSACSLDCWKHWICSTWCLLLKNDLFFPHTRLNRKSHVPLLSPISCLWSWHKVILIQGEKSYVMVEKFRISTGFSTFSLKVISNNVWSSSKFVFLYAVKFCWCSRPRGTADFVVVHLKKRRLIPFHRTFMQN